LVHCDRLDASRAAWMAGNSSATRMPMMAITTNNSTSVNPCMLGRRAEDMILSPTAGHEEKRKRRLPAEETPVRERRVQQ
jgi:hypothetical protein